MVLTIFTLQDFTGLGNFETFRDCVVALHKTGYIEFIGMSSLPNKVRYTLRFCKDCCQLSTLSSDRLLDFNRDFSVNHVDKMTDVVHTEVSMAFFATTQNDLDLDFVTLLKKFLGLFLAHIHVVITDASRQTDTFDFHTFLLSLLFLHFFVLFVLVFAEVDDFGDWGFGFGLNDHEIKFSSAGFGKCFRGGNKSNMLAIFADEADLWGTNEFIDKINGWLHFWFEFSARDAHWVGN